MRALFLDIDGVMVPSSVAFEGNRKFNRCGAPSNIVALLRYFVNESGAKVVTNTTHNGSPHLSNALGDWLGSDAVIGRTDYPSVGRKEAVQTFLATHPEITEWVAFDDADWGHENLILCDCDAGLTLRQVNEALGRFGIKPALVLM